MSKGRLWLFLEAKLEMLSKGVCRTPCLPPKALGPSVSTWARGLLTGEIRIALHLHSNRHRAPEP